MGAFLLAEGLKDASAGGTSQSAQRHDRPGIARTADGWQIFGRSGECGAAEVKRERSLKAPDRRRMAIRRREARMP